MCVMNEIDDGDDRNTNSRGINIYLLEAFQGQGQFELKHHTNGYFYSWNSGRKKHYLNKQTKNKHAYKKDQQC